MKEVFSPGALPSIPAIYALYGRTSRKAVAYVGSAEQLKGRIRDHLVRRNSSVFTGEQAVRLNPDLIGKVCWWERQDFGDSVVLRAAELVACRVLDPVVRSQAPAPKESAQLLTDAFVEDMERTFRSSPAGVYLVPTLQDALAKLSHLEERISAVERTLKLNSSPE